LRGRAAGDSPGRRPREPAMSCCASSQAAEPPVSPLAGFQRLPDAHRAGGPRRWALRPWRAFLARFRGLPCPAPPARPLWTVSGQVGRGRPAQPWRWHLRGSGAGAMLTLGGQRPISAWSSRPGGRRGGL